MTRRQSFVSRWRNNGLRRRTCKLAGKAQSFRSKIVITPEVAGFGVSSIWPASVFPSPMISRTMGFRVGVTEQLLLSEVVPKFAKVERITPEPIVDVRCIAEGAGTATAVRLPA